MVGYKTERRTVRVVGDSTQIDVSLQVAAAMTPEIVVSAYDPGVGIMRRAIARKERQRDSLESYTYMLYTKFVASTDTLTAGRPSGRNDTTIVSIFESFSRGYHRQPDDYYNEIIQRRQTANIPPESNFVVFGTSLNAYEDVVTILGEEIATPFHPDALDFYDFVLEESYMVDDSVKIDRVRVTPQGEGRRLFTGYVEVDDRRSVPHYVDLVPNRAVQLPFDASLRYRQKFDEVDGGFVVPTGMHIYSSLQASIFWIFAPRLDITIETVAYDYELNSELDGDLFAMRRVEATPQADTFDSTFWRERVVMPLRPEERAAYQAIEIAEEHPDSLQGTGYFGKIFSAITDAVATLNRPPSTGLNDIFRYNRVTGAYVGGGLFGELLPGLEGAVRAGYGTADRRLYGELSLRRKFDESGTFSIAGNLYRRLARRDNPYVVSGAAITALALLYRNDYGDYYYADGFDLGLEAGFGQLRFVRRDVYTRPTTIRLYVRNEEQRTAGNNATFAFLGGDRLFRTNPAIFDGRLRSVGLEINVGFSPMRRISDFGFQLGTEVSDPSIVPTDFSFRQFYGALLWRTPTLPLWQLDLRLSGGITLGDVPPQRFFSLESSASNTAGEGVFRGMGVKEFYGDRYAAVSMEHNFGEVIPGVLRIPNIASFGIEFILLGRAGWTAFSDETRTYTGTTLPSTDATDDRYYYEAGIGFNRVLLFFRTDLSVRLSQVERPRFMFTISTATR
jgi:hypothetical protein